MRNNEGSLLLALSLVVAACGSTSTESLVYIGEEFSLTEGDSVHVLETELTICAETVIDGLDGSQEPGVGSVYLSVDNGREADIEVYLETGSWKTLGEFELHFLEVIGDSAGVRARMKVR